METLKKEVLIGLIIGIISNVAGSYLYIYFFSTFSLEETINKAIETNVIGNIIALGAILNLFVFFIFIKKKSNIQGQRSFICHCYKCVNYTFY